MYKTTIFFLISIFLLTGCNINNPVTSIELPYSDFNSPALVGDEMLIPVNVDSEYINKIVSFNLSNYNEKTVYDTSFSNDSAINSLRANEKWAVWEDSDSFGQQSKLLAMDLISKDIKVLSESDPEIVTIYSPQLYNHFVAWVDFKSGAPDIVLYNLKNDEYQVIAQLNVFALYNNFVHMSQDYLLWTDSKEGEGYYYLYHLGSGSIEEISSPHPYPGYAKIGENKIYAIHFNDHRTWVIQEFGYYDLTQKEYYSFAREDYINMFQVYEDKIAIINGEQQLELYKIMEGKPVKVEEDNEDLLNYSYVDSIDFSYDGKLLIGQNDIDSGKVLISVVEY